MQITKNILAHFPAAVLHNLDFFHKIRLLTDDDFYFFGIYALYL